MDGGKQGGGVPAVVAGSGGVLLIGTVVFFVHNHESELPEWQENRRPGAEDYPAVGLPQFVAYFFFGRCRDTGMETQEFVSEIASEAFLQLAAQGDFRHQVEHAAVGSLLCNSSDGPVSDGPASDSPAFYGSVSDGPATNGFQGQFDVYFSFPGPCDSVQQHRFADFEGLADFIIGPLLILGQFRCRAYVFTRNILLFPPFRYDGFFFLLSAHTRVGGLVHFAHSAHIIRSYGSPESYFLFRHLRQCGRGLDGVHFNGLVSCHHLCLPWKAADHPNILLSGKQYLHPGALFQRIFFVCAVIWFPVQFEGKNHRYEHLSSHFATVLECFKTRLRKGRI